MKLKPIIASMMLLGLAAPAFAGDAGTQAQLDQMKAQINKMQSVINQNSAGGYQQAADWMSRITLSGMLNVDSSYGNQAPYRAYTGSTNKTGDTSNIGLSNVNLLLDAMVNDWTTVHLNLLYSDAQPTGMVGPVQHTNSARNATFDEAYVTIANFNQSPLYLKAGREYVPFGSYNLYPMVMNPTQALTQTQGTALQGGFVSPMGMYASVYTFRGLDRNTAANTPDTRPRVENYGFDVGYANTINDVGMKLDAGWIKNMADATQISGIGGYAHQVSGLNLSAGLSVQQFDVKADYVTALQDFSQSDLATYSYGDAKSGAKPSAWGVEAGYSFPVINNHDSRLAVGYQHSKDSARVGSTSTSTGYGLAQSRWYGSYTVNASKWTDVGFELYRDAAYNASQGGSGGNSTVGMVRLGVKFA